jgi:hypothetical protein
MANILRDTCVHVIVGVPIRLAAGAVPLRDEVHGFEVDFDVSGLVLLAVRKRHGQTLLDILKLG